MGASRGLQSLSFGSTIAVDGQWVRQLLMIQARHTTATEHSSGAACVQAGFRFSQHAGGTNWCLWKPSLCEQQQSCRCLQQHACPSCGCFGSEVTGRQRTFRPSCKLHLWPTNPYIMLPSVTFNPTQIAGVQQQVDVRVRAMFSGITVTLPVAADADAGAAGQQQQQSYNFPDLDDAAFAALGRDQPRVLMALLDAAQSADKAAWQGFQADVQTLKLQRQRLSGQLADARGLLESAEREAAKQQGLGLVPDRAQLLQGAPVSPLVTKAGLRPVRIVLICGFESFNVGE